MKKGSFAAAKGVHLLQQLKAQAAPKPEQRKPPPSEPSIEDELRAAHAKRKPLTSPHTQVRPPKGKKIKKEVIRLTRAEKERLLAEFAQPSTAREPPPQRKLAPTDLGKSDFDRVQAMHRDLDLNAFAASHSAPSTIASSEAELIKKRVLRGALGFSSAIDDSGMSFFIGYDLGTSTTKVVVRSPYDGLRNAFAVEVPAGMCSSGSPHLWPTALWFDPHTGRFSLTPETGFVRLDSFKSALIQNCGHRTCAATGVTMAEAATAFLAMHIAYVVGACLERDPNLRLSGINFAVPVAAMAEKRLVSGFEEVFGTALALMVKAPKLSIEDVRAIRGNVVAVPLLPFSTTELSGAIAGYCAAPRHHLGGHMIIDCGSGTLDIASFLLAADQLQPVGIYAARVEPIGADACTTYRRLGMTAEACRRAARYLEHLVYADTIDRRRSSFAQDGGKYPYQIILTGGGIHSSILAPLMKAMEKAFHSKFYRPGLSNDLEYDQNCEPGRLILADGLARDPAQLREVVMPADQPSAPTTQVEFVSKDQV